MLGLAHLSGDLPLLETSQRIVAHVEGRIHWHGNAREVGVGTDAWEVKGGQCRWLEEPSTQRCRRIGFIVEDSTHFSNTEEGFGIYTGIYIYICEVPNVNIKIVDSRPLSVWLESIQYT